MEPQCNQGDEIGGSLTGLVQFVMRVRIGTSAFSALLMRRNSVQYGGALPHVQENGNFFIPSAYFCCFFAFTSRYDPCVAHADKAKGPVCLARLSMTFMANGKRQN